MNKLFYLILCLSFSSFAFSNTYEKIKKRGHIKCGVSTGVTGFSAPDSKGAWKGIDVDVCRALSAAVFGNSEKVKYTPLSAQQRFTALQSGEVDLLSRNTTNTLNRDTALGLNFAPTIYYDGQGFMVKKGKRNITKISQLKGATVCVQQGTTTELNLADYSRAKRMKWKTVVFESEEEVLQAFLKGRCDAVTDDASGLASKRARVKKPESLQVLSEVISKEPLGPAVRHGDDRWFDIVTWTVHALVAAEEMGISSKNIDNFKKTKDPKIKRFLGISEGNGKALGLSEKWSYNIIKNVGNYGEVFERNIGKQTKLGLERGLNALWTNQGLMFAPPLR